MASKETLKRRLEIRERVLENTYEAYEKLLSGGIKSYAIGSRNLTRFDLPQLESTITLLEKEVDQLERAVTGNTGRKVISVVPRDF